MVDSYPQWVGLHEKLQRLVIEAEARPLTIGDGLNWMATGTIGYGFHCCYYRCLVRCRCRPWVSFFSLYEISTDGEL